MLKPLSRKTLDKRYAELGLSEKELNLLHLYFRIFSNLYGVMSVEFAWDIFKNYEKTTGISKSDFVCFAGVAQREDGLPYYVIDENELFSEEENDPEYRMIVNKILVGKGQYRFADVYDLIEQIGRVPFYFPNKETFLSFQEERFYKTVQGKRFVRFISALKSSGRGRKLRGEGYIIKDIYGVPAKGRRLDELTVFTPFEKADIEYYKKEETKNQLKQAFAVPCSEKILQAVKEDILFRDDFYSQAPYEHILCELSDDFGVEFDKNEFEKFLSLYTDLNNYSNQWCLMGWSPNELSKNKGSNPPSAVKIGPNMQRLAKNGELDIEEFVKLLEEHGTDVIL